MFMKLPTTLYLQRYILEQMGEEDVGGSQLTQDAVNSDAIDATLCWFRVRSVGAAGYWWGMHGTSGTVLGCQSATWSHYCMQSRLHCGRFAVWHFHVSRCSLQFTSLHFIYPPVQNTNAMCTVGNVLQQSGRLQQGATCTNNCPI